MLFKVIANLLFPFSCLNCGRTNNLLCVECTELLRQELSPRRDFIPLNSNTTESILLTVYSSAAYDFNSVLTKTIKRFKYKFNRELTNILTARLYLVIYHQLNNILRFRSQILLVPVPISKSRYKWRGFNQADLLAEQLSEMTGIQVWRGLARVDIISQQSQVGLSSKIRRNNLQGKFYLKSEIPVPCKQIIIIDDVVTTGSTLRACWETMRLQNSKIDYLGLCLASRLPF